MIVIVNRFLPLPGFKAMTVWPFVLVRKGKRFDDVDMNHEEIHGRQQKEMLFVGFFVWYVVEWLVRLLMPGNAYRNISLEREARVNERDLGYLERRRHWAWWKYLWRRW